MARARNIKPSFFKNELLGAADPLLGLLFISLWTLADKEGRLEDRPLRIKAETFPYRENIDINSYLTQLLQLGFIDRYTVGDVTVIQVVTFKDHQSPHSTEKASKLPAKPMNTPLTQVLPLDNESANVTLNINVLNPDSLLLNPDSLKPETLKPEKTTRAKRTPPPDKPSDVDPQVWQDWEQLRKAKRAPITKTTVEVAASEAAKAGLSLNDFLKVWCSRGSQGLEASWLKPNEGQTGKPQFLTPQQQRDENNRRSTAEFLADDTPFFSGHNDAIDGEYTNA